MTSSSSWSLLFSSLSGKDLDFGMEVHVNSFQQITKEDQHRKYLHLSWSLCSFEYKLYNQKSKAKKYITNNRKCAFYMFFVWCHVKKMQKRPALNRPNPPRELTIIEHLPSKSAKHSGLQDLLNTKSVAQNSFKYSYSISTESAVTTEEGEFNEKLLRNFLLMYKTHLVILTKIAQSGQTYVSGQ